MGYIFLLAAIFAENTGKIFDKYNYNNTRVTPRELLRLVFGVMAAAIISFIIVTRPQLPSLSMAVLISLAFVVGLSFISNVFDEISLKINNLSLREPLSNFRPILAGFIGYMLFPEERDLLLLVALMLGAVVVAWGVKPSRLAKAQRAGITYMALAVLAEASLSNAYAVALENVGPEYIALVRTVFILVLLAIFFKPRKRNRKREKKSTQLAIAAGLAYSAGAIVSLYAIDRLGIVTAMLLLLLSPALRYASAYIFLKDKPTKHEIISSGLLGIIAAFVAFV